MFRSTKILKNLFPVDRTSNMSIPYITVHPVVFVTGALHVELESIINSLVKIKPFNLSI